MQFQLLTNFVLLIIMSLVLASSHSTFLLVFSTHEQRSHRLSCSTGAWIDLGAFGSNELSIKRNLSDSEGSPPFVEMKAADSSKSGRTAVILGCIANIKARRHDSDAKTIVWTIENSSHHVQIRTFASKFKTCRQWTCFYGFSTVWQMRLQSAALTQEQQDLFPLQISILRRHQNLLL